jgi:hypothetical protein
MYYLILYNQVTKKMCVKKGTKLSRSNYNILHRIQKDSILISSKEIDDQFKYILITSIDLSPPNILLICI